MPTPHALIIDDEEHCREALQQLIADYFPEVHLTEICSNPQDGIAAIKKHNPDLVFLDVEMPGMTGFELLQQLPEITFALIFSTAYDKYAVRAFKASALDFLLKPVGKEDLTEALSKVRARIKKESPVKQLEVLYENMKYSHDPLKKMVIPTINGFDFVLINEIVRLESDSNYTTFHFKDKTSVMVARTLKDFEELLADHHFFRVHQSHLINLRFLRKYIRGEGGIAVMEDGKEVDISRRRKEDFLKALQKL